MFANSHQQHGVFGALIVEEGDDLDAEDTGEIGNKEYTITGFFQRPDYLYMLQNEDDTYKNITTFYLAYLTDEEFENIDNKNCQYFVRYNTDNQNDFRKEINNNYHMRTYLPAQENARIDMVKMQAEIFSIVSYIILAIMPLIVVVLVSIVINRKVKSEEKLIGTLTALGYKKDASLCRFCHDSRIIGRDICCIVYNDICPTF